jgi:hypothetical protein
MRRSVTFDVRLRGQGERAYRRLLRAHAAPQGKLNRGARRRINRNL